MALRPLIRSETPVGRSPESPFARAVKRAFADALLTEIRRSRIGRDEAAKLGQMSRTYLQFLLAAERQATIGTLICLAEGLGMRPEVLMAKTMEHLERLRAAERTELSSDSSVT